MFKFDAKEGFPEKFNYIKTWKLRCDELYRCKKISKAREAYCELLYEILKSLNTNPTKYMLDLFLKVGLNISLCSYLMK